MNTRANALVTGGAGFIGSHLVDRLLESGFNVRVLDDLSNGQVRNIEQHIGKKNFQLSKGSVNNPDVLGSAMRGVDIVFHLAAIVNVAKSLANPRLVNRVNVGGTVAVLEEARRSDTKSVVFASSAAVYGDQSKPPLTEDSLPAPLSPYGSTKVAGETYCNSFFRSYGLRTASLRYFNVYGSRCSTGEYSGVIMRFADNVFNKRPLTVYGDGGQSRDFVNVQDVIEATMLAAESKGAGGEAFNVGTGASTTVLELARTFLRFTVSNERGIIHLDKRKGDIRKSWADVGKARRILGYRPKVALDRGLKSFLSWYSSEYAADLYFDKRTRKCR